ncbi:Alkaline phosphatase 4 precursor [Candidatus Ornithobacterium hominis]|uniref:alkaline phosphatase n=1 Tax=Candidatus Ornithobacterium hominis TaxID=2497989 RepID=UPI000E5ACCDB|nr:alkaline phosphatase [Candidatus Ornithobacterium hominis]SZD72609.1 Alkaline phosphatase 4 precursor [Candidatus Ornithobacterium hominis]
MKRREFFKNSSLLGLGAFFLGAESLKSNTIREEFRHKKTKNIIFMVSDGMSSGTLAMSDIYSKRILGKPSAWLGAYQDDLMQRGLMDMASKTSIVTDSAAASSSWGGGHRVPNGNLNIGAKGEEYEPILQKFKKAGKKVGCVTTVPITHATPAGFCVNIKSRSDQAAIAEKYATLDFDVMMGGGQKYFDPKFRKDKKDMYAVFTKKGYHVAKNKSEMLKAQPNQKLLGVFTEDSLPYSVDAKTLGTDKTTPNLLDLTQKAIEQMKSHSNGFVLQVEAGKVDWAAHGNDFAALLFDQLMFDSCVNHVLDFAKKDGNTLVVITSDHGNANPGLVYGKGVDPLFDNTVSIKHSNDWILQGIRTDATEKEIIDRLYENSGNMKISTEHAKEIIAYYKDVQAEDGIYNPKHLPFLLLSKMQYEHFHVGWNSMNHTSDYTELAMYGPGSEHMKSFMRNDQMHNFLLKVAEVDMLNKA